MEKENLSLMQFSLFRSRVIQNTQAQERFIVFIVCQKRQDGPKVRDGKVLLSTGKDLHFAASGFTVQNQNLYHLYTFSLYKVVICQIITHELIHRFASNFN